MNIITVTGNNVKEIELRFSPSGTAFASGSIAVRRNFKNQAGEYESDFFNFTVIGKLAEIVANHIKKGDRFGISGRLQNRVWEKDDGSKQYFTEIIVNDFDFPTKSKSNAGNNSINPDKLMEDLGGVEVNPDDMPF